MIDFNEHEKSSITSKIIDYCENELGHEMGRFDAEFFLEFISKEIGGYYYNRGLHDAHKLLEDKTDEIKESILDLETGTEFSK